VCVSVQSSKIAILFATSVSECLHAIQHVDPGELNPTLLGDAVTPLFVGRWDHDIVLHAESLRASVLNATTLHLKRRLDERQVTWNESNCSPK